MARTGLYLASQYVWIIFIYIWIFLGVIITPYRSPGTIKSLKAKDSFNSSSDPEILAHLTDIHINHQIPSTMRYFGRALEQMCAFGVKAILATGDLVDNWDTTDSNLGVGEQTKEDFVLYKEIVDVIPERNSYLEVSGNHDEYAVPSLHDPMHFIFNYSKSIKSVEKIEDWWIHVAEVSGYEIVFINPFRYPTGHAKVGFWIMPTQEMLDVIESKLLVPPAKPRIILCHFPVRLWSQKPKSSNGHSFQELIGMSNATAVLTGHLHPSTESLQHIDGILEVVGVDIAWHSSYGLMSFDNGRFVYTTASIDNPPIAIVTHPVPKLQLSKMVSFEETDSEIRVVVFTDKILNIQVTGDVEGTLIRRRELPRYQAWLYTLPLSLKEGEYHIDFTGDFESSLDFVISSSVALPKEKLYGFPNFVISSVIALAIVWVLEVFLVFPIGEIPIARDANDFIMDDTKFEDHGLTIWCLGFLLFRERIRQLPKFVRFWFCLMVFWPICLPSFFMKTGDHFGFVWTYGFVLGGEAFYDVWGHLYTAMYCCFILMPLMHFAVGVSNGWSKMTLADTIVGVFGLCVMVGSCGMLVYQAAELVFTILSPTFVILPLVMYIYLLVWSFTKSDKNYNQMYTEGSESDSRHVVHNNGPGDDYSYEEIEYSLA